MNRHLIAVGVLTVSIACLLGASEPASAQSVFKRASWLQSIQTSLYKEAQRKFKTRYDGSVWAKACGKQGVSQRLGLNRKELRAFVFDRLNEHRDIKKIVPLEKWTLVNSVVDMADAYIQGARAFVKPSAQDCRIVLRGLQREFPQ